MHLAVCVHDFAFAPVRIHSSTYLNWLIQSSDTGAANWRVVNAGTTVGFSGYICTSLHSESVYNHIRMWLLNGVRYNVWREGGKLPFPVWGEVWNGVQL